MHASIAHTQKEGAPITDDHQLNTSQRRPGEEAKARRYNIRRAKWTAMTVHHPIQAVGDQDQQLAWKTLLLRLTQTCFHIQTMRQIWDITTFSQRWICENEVVRSDSRDRIFIPSPAVFPTTIKSCR